eukprot:146423-Chlamydomonas_euryale.AAC.1
MQGGRGGQGERGEPPEQGQWTSTQLGITARDRSYGSQLVITARDDSSWGSQIGITDGDRRRVREGGHAQAASNSLSN